MKENGNKSKLKKFIKDAFTSEAKASRIPYYFFAICILLTVICLELNTANRYLKRISNGGLGAYNYETNPKSNDPYEIFSEKTTEQPSEKLSAENKSDETKADAVSSTQNTNNVPTNHTTESKPQGKITAYVINKSSKKIHYPNCSYVSNIKEENKLTVNLTADELNNQYLSNGYVFCSKCGG